MRPLALGNDEIADALDRVADLLEVQDASGFRVRAYRRAAGTLRSLPRPAVETLVEGGTAALEALPGIGKRIAEQVREMGYTGRLSLLDRLEGQVTPEALFATLPGVGPSLAERLHRELGVETLEELELAAHDGRIEALAGFGGRRVQSLRDSLSRVLGDAARRRARAARARDAGSEPIAVATLLEVDTEYRERAAAGTLRTIAPRRFNPEGRSWLPVLHVEHDGIHFTALFSNTARAHELGRTRDWVVVYAERDGEEDRFTVVTEHAGPWTGRRVVRGHELECARHYEASLAAPGSSPAAPSSEEA